MAIASFEMFMIFFVAIVSPLIMVLILIMFDLWNVGKDVILYFNSHKDADLKKKRVKDGTIKMGKRIFLVDKIVPMTIKTGLFFKTKRHLYFLKHDRALPMDISEAGFRFGRSPTNMKNLLENKLMDKILTPKGSNWNMILFLAIGAVMGGLIGYLLATTMTPDVVQNITMVSA